MDCPQTSASADAMQRMVNEETRFLGAMIHSLPSARLSSPAHRASHSSLGRLNQFPAEVLIMILDYLDFQSLSRIAQTSTMGKDIVEGLAVYKCMMQHAPEVLTALGRTGLLRYHPATLLHQTLRSKECVSCREFGAFLLPTSERVCFDCLDRNSALRVMRTNDAKTAFGLTEAHLKGIPVMKSIPGKYAVTWSTSQRRPLRLVNVRQAKRLALRVHGSSEALSKHAPRVRQGESRRKPLNLKALHDALLENPGSDMSKMYRQRNLPEDDLGGIATIRFPFVSPEGTADVGRLCRGCEVTATEFKYGRLPERVRRELSGPLCGGHEPLRAAVSRLRTREDFVEHVEHCYGVQQLRTLEEHAP
jgi:hypothetical protein